MSTLPVVAAAGGEPAKCEDLAPESVGVNGPSFPQKPFHVEGSYHPQLPASFPDNHKVFALGDR